jgi:hypothetical protein
MKTYFSSKLFLALALVAVGVTQQAVASSSSGDIDDLAAMMGGLSVQMSALPAGDAATLDALCAGAVPLLTSVAAEFRAADTRTAGMTFQEKVNDGIEHPISGGPAQVMQIVFIGKELVEKLNALIAIDASWVATGAVGVVLRQVTDLMVLGCKQMHLTWESLVIAYPEEVALVAANDCLFRGLFQNIERSFTEMQSASVITAEHLLRMQELIPNENVMSSFQMRAPNFLSAMLALARRMGADDTLNVTYRDVIASIIPQIELQLAQSVMAPGIARGRRDSDDEPDRAASPRRRSRSRSRSRDRAEADDRDRDRASRK